MVLKHTKSFTLIEMLIVIVIIGILAAALIPRLQSVQGRARDTQRKVDLKSIYNANEIYRVDYGIYAPTCAASGCSTSSSSLFTRPRLVHLSGLMTSIPVDPRNFNSTGIWPWMTGNYTYYYGDYISGALKTYDLSAQLENRTDPDRCEVRQFIYSEISDNLFYPRCGGTGWSAGHPNTKYLYDFSPDSKSF